MRFRKREQINSVLLVAVLSLIGITLFQTVFEARARYLFNYSPFFIFVSAIGWMENVKLCAPKIKSIYRSIIKSKGAEEK